MTIEEIIKLSYRDVVSVTSERRVPTTPAEWDAMWRQHGR